MNWFLHRRKTLMKFCFCRICSLEHTCIFFFFLVHIICIKWWIKKPSLNQVDSPLLSRVQSLLSYMTRCNLDGLCRGNLLLVVTKLDIEIVIQICLCKVTARGFLCTQEWPHKVMVVYQACLKFLVIKKKKKKKHLSSSVIILHHTFICSCNMWHLS